MVIQFIYFENKSNNADHVARIKINKKHYNKKVYYYNLLVFERKHYRNNVTC